MKEAQVEFFQRKLSELKIDSLGAEEISLLYEMNRYQSKNQGLVK